MIILEGIIKYYLFSGVIKIGIICWNRSIKIVVVVDVVVVFILRGEIFFCVCDSIVVYKF